MKQSVNTELYVFVVNDDGFIINSTTVDTSERELYKNEISTPFPPLVKLEKPKWNGTEWVEGETEEEKDEREAIERLNALQPSPEELDDAKVEIKILTLLTDLEMI